MASLSNVISQAANNKGYIIGDPTQPIKNETGTNTLGMATQLMSGASASYAAMDKTKNQTTSTNQTNTTDSVATTTVPQTAGGAIRNAGGGAAAGAALGAAIMAGTETGAATGGIWGAAIGAGVGLLSYLL